MRRRLAIAASVMAFALVSASPVLAQTPPGDTESWGDLLDDGAEVGVFQPAAQGGSGGQRPSGSGNLVCTYTIRQGSVEVPFTEAAALTEYNARNQSPVPVDWHCMDGTTVAGGPDTLQWTPSDGNVIDPERLAQLARSRLYIEPPSGDVAPSIGVGTQAQMDTYFWLDNWPVGGAEPSASASAGGVTVTATATPVSHTWWIRDSVRGTFPVRCGAGPGAAYSGSGAPPAGACVWTPQHSSAGQSSTHSVTGEPCFAATVTVVWNVTWSGGNLGSLATHANTCIVVHEIQAVVSQS